MSFPPLLQHDRGGRERWGGAGWHEKEEELPAESAAKVIYVVL